MAVSVVISLYHKEYFKWLNWWSLFFIDSLDVKIEPKISYQTWTKKNLNSVHVHFLSSLSYSNLEHVRFVVTFDTINVHIFFLWLVGYRNCLCSTRSQILPQMGSDDRSWRNTGGFWCRYQGKRMDSWWLSWVVYVSHLWHFLKKTQVILDTVFY